MGGGWRCAGARKQQAHISSWVRWPTRSESVAGWASVCRETSVTGGAGVGRASEMPVRVSCGLWSAGYGENARALAYFRHKRERATRHARASLVPIDRLDP